MIKYINQIQLIELLRGLNSRLPVSLMRQQGTGGTNSAAYCYSVWLRHAVTAWKAGVNPIPQTVAELGPGDSLGIGLTALLFGAKKYYAFDVVKFADIENNLSLFDKIVSFVQECRSIPGREEFPELKPQLDDYRFPNHIFSEKHLCHCLTDERIRRIRESVKHPDKADSVIHYAVPWSSDSVMQEKSIDLIFSQAVLEHVDDLAGTYRAMHKWLKDDGYISHQIDFKSHGTARDWNGHWLYPDALWKIIRGKRPYLLNRQPYSTHKRMLEQASFAFLREKIVNTASVFRWDEFDEQYQKEDIEVSGVHILAVKRVDAR
ncbi:MAG: methyltransferase domain-containing protein [Candidatus Electrothrix sp. AU1_5]|nr:methyltransferase domain-containing protein [Candidatus Electrothrix gigas]